MKFNIYLLTFISAILIGGCRVSKKATSQTKVLAKDSTLLWKISGNGLTKPSYILGTMHLQCAKDAVLSDSALAILNRVEKIYFELDMSNPLAMLGAMSKMNMKGDTTLKDLLSEMDYNNLKNYYKSIKALIPFSMMERMMPMLASATLMEHEAKCDGGVSGTEMRIMEWNKKNRELDTDGLEEVADQLNAIGTIPYKEQAAQLMEYVKNRDKLSSESKKLIEAFKSQNLEKIEELILTSDPGMAKYMDALLINRNKNWVVRFKKIFPKESVLVAVGAGHLVGKQGVLQLMLDAGYNVEPIRNK